jgi:hypothetical protein
MQLQKSLHLWVKHTIMKTQTYLHISTPCNEDWNKMSNSEKGRFCDSCASQVIDFTVMTDHQVLAYMAANQGKVCGRFNTEQMDRGLNDTSIKKKKIWQWALTGFTSLFFASKGLAQSNVKKELPQAAFLLNNNNQAMMDMNNQSITIKGKVLDDAHALLAKASIIEPGSMNKVFTNRNGQFVMQVDAFTESVLVQANGFDSRVVPVSMLSNNSDTSIVLTQADTTGPVPLGFDKKALDGTAVIMGGITNYTEVEKPNPVTTFVKKVFNAGFFKILPNPSVNGSLGLSVKQAGTYTVQIFDNNSKLLHMAEITVNSKGEVVRVALPTCISKGTYYVRLVDSKTKKEYVDKMIVQ